MKRTLLILLAAFILLLASAAVMWYLPLKDMSAYQGQPAPPDKVTLFAFGDQGSADWRQRRVAAMLEAACRKTPSLAFVQTLGDNFYFKGVQSLDDPLWKSALEDIYNTPCIRNKPFHAVLGNHDEEGDPDVQIAYSHAHKGKIRWVLPDHFYFSRTGAHNGKPLVTMVMLDTNMPMQDQIALIDKIFADPDDTYWRIVVGHHNVRTNSKKYHTDDRLRKALLPALLRNHVQFYLSGHSHNQQLIEMKGEPVYIIDGAGGKHPRPVLAHSDTPAAYANQALGFVALTFNTDTATIRFYSTSRQLFSTFSTNIHQFTVKRNCIDSPDHNACVQATP